MTQEKFIEKAKAFYGDKYDYSKVVYNGWDGEVIVIDKNTKEERTVKPKYFLYDHKYKKGKPMTKEEKANAFIKKSKEKFGDRFDYSKVVYVNSQTLVTLICKEHGEFSVNMYTHLYSKDGLCPFCNNRSEFTKGGRRQLSTDYIIRKCQYIYGDKYDYSKIEYKGDNSRTELVEIICPIHGSFFKRLDSINSRDCGCPKCAKRKSIEKRVLNGIISHAEKFIENSKSKFGDVFDYSEVEYVNGQTPITLIYKKDSIKFSIIPTYHLQNKFGGCKEYRRQYLESKRDERIRNGEIKSKLTEEERKERRKERGKNRFIERATKKFGDRFDYSIVKYDSCKTLVDIIDKESNNEVFSITPSSFLISVDGRPDKKRQ